MASMLENQKRLIEQEKSFLKELEEEKLNSLSLLSEVEKELGIENIQTLGKENLIKTLKEKGIHYHGIEFYTLGFGYIETDKYVFDFIWDKYQSVKIKNESKTFNKV